MHRSLAEDLSFRRKRKDFCADMTVFRDNLCKTQKICCYDVNAAQAAGANVMKSLPLVQLSLLRPILIALRERGHDPATVLESVGLTEDAVARDNETVHVMVVHQFLEACASTVRDPTFCAAVGARLDPTGWPMIEAALKSGCSLADFLAIYISGANEVASSVTAYLDIRGDRTVYGESRLFKPSIVPAQNDGFMVGLAISILRRVLGGQLDASKMTLVLCDPCVLPTSFSKFSRLKRGMRWDSELSFRPRGWCIPCKAMHRRNLTLKRGAMARSVSSCPSFEH